MSADLDEERALYGAFLAPPTRARYLALLDAPDARRRIRAELAHAPGLDPRYATRVEAEPSPEEIARLLREKGAPETCYVVSEWPDFDARRLDLVVALDAIVGSGMATFFSCVPGKLAYFEDEEVGERYLLAR